MSQPTMSQQTMGNPIDQPTAMNTGTAQTPATPTSRARRCEEHHATVRMHLFIAAGIGALGFLLLATGALMSFAIPVLCIAVLYAAMTGIIGFMQDCADNRMGDPRPQELDSAADYYKAKNG